MGTEELAEGEEVKIKESKAVKKARKKMAERRNSMAPIVNIPYIPQHRSVLADYLSFPLCCVKRQVIMSCRFVHTDWIVSCVVCPFIKRLSSFPGLWATGN